MSSDASLDERDEEALAEALEGYFSALEAGNAPDPTAYAEGFPRIAKRLRRCLAGLTNMHDAMESNSAGLSSASGKKRLKSSRQSLPTGYVLGDFRLLQEIGRGGMGVVYEAEQISLARRVAVKVLPFAAFLDARRRQRFLNEAHAAATLQHEHIVPVYATGCEQGVNFYAMRLIDGPSLATLLSDARRKSSTTATMPLFGDSSSTIDRRSNPSRSTSGKPSEVVDAVRLTLQVASALQHAHDLGVVHRDVKPGNILLDHRGHAWLTDFGLARREAAENLTDDGDLVGTLRYMSPEQAAGNSALADPRSDVYSLGSTLYEMLARRPVFEAEDRTRLLRKIMEDDPTPLRKVAPHIPRDLETIVHRTLAKDPDARYQSAAEFAADLERFLNDKPILARRPSPIEIVQRWIRKHQTTSVAAAAALVVAVVVLGVNNFRLNDALNETEGYRKHAEAQQIRAERERAAANENFREALDAVDVYLLNASETRLRDFAAGATLRREMLQAAANFYERVAARRSADESLASQRANALYRLAGVLVELGDFERAGPAFDSAEQTFRRLSDLGDESAKVRLATTMIARGRLAPESYPPSTEDLRRFELVEATLDYTGQESTNSQQPFTFVRLALSKANAHRDRHELPKAVEAVRQCEAPMAELIRKLPNDTAVAQQEYALHLEKIQNAIALHRWNAARRSIEQAREAARRVGRLRADPAGTAYRLSVVDFREASLEVDVRDYEGAERALDSAEKQLAIAATSPEFKSRVALHNGRLHYSRANILKNVGDLAGAMNEYWAAEADFATLSTPANYNVYAELRRGETLYFISALNGDRSRHAEALSAALTAKSIGEALIKRRPDSGRVHALVGRAHHGIAGAMSGMGRMDEAETEFAAAAAAQREACRLAPWEPDYPRFLANHLIGRGRVFLSLGLGDEALEAFDDCCKAQPNAVYYHWTTMRLLFNKLAFLSYRDGAHKRRFLAAVAERLQKSIDLKTTEWLSLLDGSKPVSRSSRPVVKTL